MSMTSLAARNPAARCCSQAFTSCSAQQRLECCTAINQQEQKHSWHTCCNNFSFQYKGLCSAPGLQSQAVTEMKQSRQGAPVGLAVAAAEVLPFGSPLIPWLVEGPAAVAASKSITSTTSRVLSTSETVDIASLVASVSMAASPSGP